MPWLSHQSSNPLCWPSQVSSLSKAKYTADTISVAEIPYHSRITEKEEKIPFAVAIMGTPGEFTRAR
jgi:hypothetical protein